MTRNAILRNSCHFHRRDFAKKRPQKWELNAHKKDFYVKFTTQ